jgi:hypothetical protein
MSVAWINVRSDRRQTWQGDGVTGIGDGHRHKLSTGAASALPPRFRHKSSAECVTPCIPHCANKPRMEKGNRRWWLSIVPNYVLGCRRISCFSNGYIDGIHAPNTPERRFDLDWRNRTVLCSITRGLHGQFNASINWRTAIHLTGFGLRGRLTRWLAAVSLCLITHGGLVVWGKWEQISQS